MGDTSSPEPMLKASDRGYRLLCALIGALGMANLVACTPEVAPVSPEQRLAMIPTGQPLLTCRADCLAAWRAAEPQAQNLAAQHRWTDLALLVLRVNYDDDLTAYYLGEAAQGMGYRAAASSYYKQSVELSAGPASCAKYSGSCSGVSLPRAASARLAALGRPAPRRPSGPGKAPAKVEELPPAPVLPTLEGPAPTPALPIVEGPPVAPALPTVAGPLPTPVSPIRAPSREEEQYIEPPPPRR